MFSAFFIFVFALRRGNFAYSHKVFCVQAQGVLRTGKTEKVSPSFPASPPSAPSEAYLFTSQSTPYGFQKIIFFRWGLLIIFPQKHLAGTIKLRNFAVMKHAIRSLRKYITRYLVALFLLCFIVFGGGLTSCENRETGERMRFLLDSLQQANRNYEEFTSDSLQLELCRYFDRWGTRNERMKAHYLLGRAYHDMGEIPHALECYQQATEMADTTSNDCDYVTLSRIFGQMADLFFLQNLADEGEEANNKYIRYAWVARDTMAALYGYTQKSVPYYILRDTDKVITASYEAIAVCEKFNYPYTSAIYAPTIRILLASKKYPEARKLMDKFESGTDLFDKNHEIVHGRELYYYTGGLYQLGISNIDSAETCFRKSIKSGYIDLSYKGLLLVFEQRGISDSISKYAHLYAESHDRYVDDKNTVAIQQIASMYRYDSFRHKADTVEKQNASQRSWILFLLLCVSILTLSIIAVSYIYHVKNAKRKLKIERLNNEYLRIHHNYVTLSREYHELQLKELQDKSALKEDYESRLEEKMTEMNALKNEIEKLGATLKGLQRSDNMILLNGEAVVIRLRKSQRQLPDENDWEELRIVYKRLCPLYFSYITSNHELSIRDKLICLLLPLDFTSKELSVFFSVSQQSITNSKLKIGKKLFGGCSSNELGQRLKMIVID